MIERRRTPRTRTFLGGQVAFNKRSSTIDCLVRNLTPTGARLVFAGVVPLPDTFELAVRHRSLSAASRVVWRTETEAGVQFDGPAADGQGATVIPLGYARKLQDCERDKAALRRRVQVLTEGE